MAPAPPQTLSVKRKRDEIPVDALVLPDHDPKRQKNEQYTWRLVQKEETKRVAHLRQSAGHESPHYQYHSTTKIGIVLEAKPVGAQKPKDAAKDEHVQPKESQQGPEPQPEPVPVAQAASPRPRKRPGASTAVYSGKSAPAQKQREVTGPSEEEIRQFEQFSKQVEKDEQAAAKKPTSPLKYMPKVPALRYKDRHPEQAARHHLDAMDVDEYVYDTYVREVVMPDANGKLPEPKGTVGYIVLNDDDDDWWNGEDESDKEFDTDDEDENAEDYYANDYPEDELSSDDEFDRNLYKKKYRHGSDDEEYDLDDDSDGDEQEGARSDEDEDDEHFRRIARPKLGY